MEWISLTYLLYWLFTGRFRSSQMLLEDVTQKALITVSKKLTKL